MAFKKNVYKENKKYAGETEIWETLDELGQKIGEGAAGVTQDVNVVNPNPLPTELPNDVISPLAVSTDEILLNDIDWLESDFTGWTGEPMDLLGNVNNGGIFNDSANNPKEFTIKLKRTTQISLIGLGANTGVFKALDVNISGSGGAGRGVFSIPNQSIDFNTLVAGDAQYEVNALKFSFNTVDRIDLTNLFFKNQPSTRFKDYVNKWGLNPDVDTGNEEAIWDVSGEYIFTEIAQPYYISSSSASDTEPITVELITEMPNGLYLRELVTVTLQGQSKLAIPTQFPCVASNRAFNFGSSELLGDVYIYEDDTLSDGVPDTPSKVRSKIIIGNGQTQQAVYTVPEALEDGRYVMSADFVRWQGSLVRNNGSCLFKIFVAEKGKVKRVQSTRALNASLVSGADFRPDAPLVIGAGADVWVEASEASNNNLTIEAGFVVRLITN